MAYIPPDSARRGALIRQTSLRDEIIRADRENRRMLARYEAGEAHGLISPAGAVRFRMSIARDAARIDALTQNILHMILRKDWYAVPYPPTQLFNIGEAAKRTVLP